MQKVLLPVLLMLLAGCDYEVPLSQTPSAPANPALAGIWIKASTNSNPDSMEIKTAGVDYWITYTEPDTEASMSYTFKGFEIHAAGMNLIQLEWQQTYAAESKKTYIFAKLDLTPEGLSVYRLNDNVVSAACQTAEEMLNDIAVHRNNPFLFSEPMKFTKSVPQ